jgi:hypothetical protein
MSQNIYKFQPYDDLSKGAANLAVGLHTVDEISQFLAAVVCDSFCSPVLISAASHLCFWPTTRRYTRPLDL